MKVKTEDRVLNEARARAIKKALIPRSIKKSCTVSIESGKVVFSKKK